MDDGLDDVWRKMQKHRSVVSENEVEEKEDVEMELMILEDTYLTLPKGLLTDENINSRKTHEEDIKSQEKDLEILREDEVFRQELDWIIVRELLREVSETVETRERIEAKNRRLLEEEVKRVCMEISLVYNDFDFKIQEKLRIATLRLQNLERNINSTIDYIAELRRKESVYKTAFVRRSENLIKAETEVDLLGDQVDVLVKLFQKTLWTFHQHPLLLCNYSDISEICKMIKEVLYEDHKRN